MSTQTTLDLQGVDLNEARKSLASSRTDWRGYGTSVEGSMTSRDVVRTAGLDFNVIESPMQSVINGQVIDVKSKKLLVREDNLMELGVVGNKYQIVQNHDLFDFLDTVTSRGDAKYVKAGLLRGGERVWVQAELPGTMKIGGSDDEVKKYILCHSTHDGSSAVRVAITPVRLWCENQLLVAMSNAEISFSIRHTRTAQDRLSNAIRAIHGAEQTFQKLHRSYDQMYDHQITDDEAMRYFQALIPDNPDAKSHTRTENLRDKILLLYHAGAGSEVSHGTMWGAYNSVTEYVDHFRSATGASMDSRFEYAQFGEGSNLKKKAFDTALQFLN